MSDTKAKPADEFVRVGKVKDAHGVKGELFIVLFAGEAEWLENLENIRLIPEAGGEAQNFAIKSVRPHKNGLIVKSPDITDRNRAEELRGLMFEIPAEFLTSEPGESIYLKEIEGFQVFTKAKGEIGTIIGFSSNTAQDLLVVKTSWGEFEIPFVEAFVERIEFEAGEIHLDLPEGLLGELEEEKVEKEEEGEES